MACLCVLLDKAIFAGNVSLTHNKNTYHVCNLHIAVGSWSNGDLKLESLGSSLTAGRLEIHINTANRGIYFSIE